MRRFYILGSGMNQVIGSTSQAVSLAVEHIDGPKPVFTGIYEEAVDISTYEQVRDALTDLRAAQRAYMADRGNSELGAEVGRYAAEADRVLESTR